MTSPPPSENQDYRADSNSTLVAKPQHRRPHHPVALLHDIYLTRNKPSIVYFKRVKHLLTNPPYKAVVYGLGACIKGAIWLAQDVQACFGNSISVTVTTASVPCVDDILEMDDEGSSYLDTRDRMVSCLIVSFQRVRAHG